MDGDDRDSPLTIFRKEDVDLDAEVGAVDAEFGVVAAEVGVVAAEVGVVAAEVGIVGGPCQPCAPGI